MFASGTRGRSVISSLLIKRKSPPTKRERLIRKGTSHPTTVSAFRGRCSFPNDCFAHCDESPQCIDCRLRVFPLAIDHLRAICAIGHLTALQLLNSPRNRPTENAMETLFKLALATLGLASAFVARTPLLAQSVQPAAAELRAKVVRDLPGWLKQYDVPSAAVAYVAGGKLAWTAVAGEQSLGVPATETTLYNIASLTKPIVAETILRMASQNKLQLDEPIYPYWVDPDVQNNPWNKLLTPRICLSHQTGFANWRGITNNVLAFKFQPGAQSSYSGEGYFYVTRFAQNKAKTPFDQLAQQYVLGPVGMKDTSFTTQSWFGGREAEAYGKDGFTQPKVVSTWNAADNVETTVSDYARFVVSVMHNEGLSPAIAAQRLVMTRDWVPEDAAKQACVYEITGTPCHISAGMGLGWQAIDHNSVTIADHSGADPGAHTLAFFVPSKQIGVVVFTNGENGPEVIKEIVRVLYPDPVYAATVSR
jgi:CubicO group peptidase (beta-lactamase class C family)